MRVCYFQDEKELVYILKSAVWHFDRYLDEMINCCTDENIVTELLYKQETVREKILPAVNNPHPGFEFSIDGLDAVSCTLLIEILNHYKSETIEILDFLNDPLISRKCKSDLKNIDEKIIKAVKNIN